MRKITSFQRRSNRFVKKCDGSSWCTHGGMCPVFEGRWVIANERRWRRITRQMARGKFAAKACVPVPCPPFEEHVLFITSTAFREES